MLEQTQQLIEALSTGTVELTFVKVDQSLRVMKATLESSHLPQPTALVENRKQDPALLRVWDLEKLAWRSVRIASLKSWIKL